MHCKYNNKIRQTHLYAFWRIIIETFKSYNVYFNNKNPNKWCNKAITMACQSNTDRT